MRMKAGSVRARLRYALGEDGKRRYDVMRPVTDEYGNETDGYVRQGFVAGYMYRRHTSGRITVMLGGTVDGEEDDIYLLALYPAGGGPSDRFPDIRVRDVLAFSGMRWRVTSVRGFEDEYRIYRLKEDVA